MDPSQYPPQPPAAPVDPAQINPIPAVPTQTTSDNKTKLFIPLVAISVVELLLIGVLLIAGGSTQKPKNTSANSSSASQAQDPQPATSAGVQQTNDSMSQDISNLVTNTDFPASALNDESLNL